MYLTSPRITKIRSNPNSNPIHDCSCLIVTNPFKDLARIRIQLNGYLAGTIHIYLDLEIDFARNWSQFQNPNIPPPLFMKYTPICIFSRSLTFPDQAGEPGTKMRIVRSVLRNRFKLYVISFTQNLKQIGIDNCSFNVRFLSTTGCLKKLVERHSIKKVMIPYI